MQTAEFKLQFSSKSICHVSVLLRLLCCQSPVDNFVLPARETKFIFCACVDRTCSSVLFITLELPPLPLLSKVCFWISLYVLFSQTLVSKIFSLFGWLVAPWFLCVELALVNINCACSKRHFLVFLVASLVIWQRRLSSKKLNWSGPIVWLHALRQVWWHVHSTLFAQLVHTQNGSHCCFGHGDANNTCRQGVCSAYHSSTHSLHFLNRRTTRWWRTWWS